MEVKHCPEGLCSKGRNCSKSRLGHDITEQGAPKP